MKLVRIANIGLILSTITLLAAFAFPAMAATAIPIKITFAEGVAQQTDCPATFTFCGIGQVVPLGHATETILFNGACGGACDLRIITLNNGTLILDETFSSLSCPSTCDRPGRGQPFSGVLTDVIVGSTGAYAGASGTLAGTVHVAGKSTQIKLSGTLILP